MFPALPRLRHGLRRAGRHGVERGLPPSWVGYRWLRREGLDEHAARRGTAVRVVEPQATAAHALPANVRRREDLPSERGWWGYSFRDVPSRQSGATQLLTVEDVRVVSYRDPTRSGDFFPALVTSDGRSLELREIRFRPPHAPVLRSGGRVQRRDRATWVLERVYHNHSHWLTAHLPKLLLLDELGLLDDVLLPMDLSAAASESMRLAGLDPERLPRYDPDRPLVVGRLTVVETDRFRPELLQRVQAALGRGRAGAPHRRVFISRAGAARRRLLNEDEVWPLLASAGFDRVRMEDLSFTEQVELMQQTSVLVGLHGAGLTNMLACPAGADVVEIADLSFPNPNFYAVASAASHRYWLLTGEPVGTAAPLERDVKVRPEAVEEVLRRLDERAA